MTTATVTYHELPPLTSWVSDAQHVHNTPVPLFTTGQATMLTVNHHHQQEHQQHHHHHQQQHHQMVQNSLVCNNQTLNSYRVDREINDESFWAVDPTSTNFLSSTAQFHQIRSSIAASATATTTSTPTSAAASVVTNGQQVDNESDYRTKRRIGCLSARASSAPSSSNMLTHSNNISEELCLVCGDKASGYHYNALTCEGCKGFFRRSVTRKAVYHCKYGESCDIDMYMRRKCQHCRLKKCMEIGMRPERLRADSRVPSVVIPEEQCRIKREAKQRMRINGASLESNGRKTSSASSSSNSCSPQQTVSSSAESSEFTLSVETRELINRIVSIDAQFASPSNDTLMKLSEYNEVGGSYQQLAELTILNLQLIHHFTTHLPGFCKLSDEDKRSIHKTCKTEILVLRTSRCYDACEECIVFGNECKQWRYNREQYRAFIGPLADSIFDFAHSVAKMHLDQAEFVLLTAISIFSDRPGLLQPKAVEDIQEVYTSALQSYVDLRRPKQRTMFARLLMKLTDLRNFTSDQSEIFLNIDSTGTTSSTTQNQQQQQHFNSKFVSAKPQHYHQAFNSGGFPPNDNNF